MIAYEDLVAALSSWRAGQGLPPNAVHFTSAASGSVDLALPVADPIQTLGTGEIEALDDDFASDEYAADNDAESMSGVESEPEVIGEADEISMVSNVLDYGDDESEQTAIASDFHDSAAATPYDDQEEIAVDDVQVEEVASAPSDFGSSEPHTEEVEMLSEFGDEESGDHEGPTQFSGMEVESTVMGIGVDELQGPGPRRDTEE